MNLPDLTFGQYQLVYNMLSLAIAAMLGSFIFFVVGRNLLAYKFRPAMIMASLVVGIAGYHYWRIFNSWSDAYTLIEGTYVASGVPFNDAYRYVDWLLTVPLLVAELVAVLTLAKKQRVSLTARLVVASSLMVALGYPGELAAEQGTRILFGALSCIPFAYILRILWRELSDTIADQAPEVQYLIGKTRMLLVATWLFYPVAFVMPLTGFSGASTTVGLQVGYSLADIAAKCAYGLMIYSIARAKMEAENLSAEALPVPVGQVA